MRCSTLEDWKVHTNDSGSAVLPTMSAKRDTSTPRTGHQPPPEEGGAGAACGAVGAERA